MVRIQLFSIVIVLLSIVHAQSQLIFGRENYCIATASLVKGQPVFTVVKLSPKDGRVEREALIASSFKIGGDEEMVRHQYAKMRYSLPLGVEPNEDPMRSNPRRYLIESLDGRQIKKEAFVKALQARKDCKMHVLLLEPERVLSPLEKELLNPKTIVIRTFDITLNWYHGDKSAALPRDYVRKVRPNEKAAVVAQTQTETRTNKK